MGLEATKILWVENPILVTFPSRMDKSPLRSFFRFSMQLALNRKVVNNRVSTTLQVSFLNLISITEACPGQQLRIVKCMAQYFKSCRLIVQP